MPSRRRFALGLVGLALAAPRAEAGFVVTLSKAEWRARLSPDRYAVLREGATEPAFSSPLHTEHRRGTYLCGGCENPVYPSSTKFDSGTGWPSFWDALPGAIGTRPDRSLLRLRTEVHCARCGGHLGHVFDDGPSPTGKRHCLNGLALTFVPV